MAASRHEIDETDFVHFAQVRLADEVALGDNGVSALARRCSDTEISERERLRT